LVPPPKTFKACVIASAGMYKFYLSTGISSWPTTGHRVAVISITSCGIINSDGCFPLIPDPRFSNRRSSSASDQR
jgi:hypothetical protein